MSDMHPTHEARKKIDPIDENIQTVVELHKRAEYKVSPQQRTIENVADFLGRPRFLFIILIVVTAWIVVNILLMKFGLSSFDPPPFIWLQGVITLAALLQATMILITQNRQDMMTERRMQLDLQVSLILDEKMSKLITMVDELRRVHPDLENGTDPQAEALKKTVDPHESVKNLEQLLEDEEQESITHFNKS
jgi:uncharacterized membrane protein